MLKSIYKTVAVAKNGSVIPVLQNDKTIESRYDPDKEAINNVSLLSNDYNFFILLGIGSGKIIEKIIEKYPNCKIIAVEITQNDLLFLHKNNLISKFMNNENIVFSTLDDLENDIVNNYIPSFYGNYKIIENKNWINYNSEYIKIINNVLTKAIGIVIADYSVQCHFGKIWQSNIMNNLKMISNYSQELLDLPDISKTAVIVAAGPSLDKNIYKIKNNTNNSYIISTDTAYPILLKNNIIPDIVITIDGQNISHCHYNKIINKKTIFFLDFCSSYTITNKLISLNSKIMLFTSGHPLSSMINNLLMNKIINLFSGSGTVTITALDLAIKLGFKNIKLYGADFCYNNGKAYASGTYFDYIYGENSTKLNSIEKKYSNLIYRNEDLNYENNQIQTKLLNSYKKSCIEYLANNNCTFTFSNDVYNIRNNSKKSITKLENPKIDYIKINNKLLKQNLTVPLLPFISWLRNNSKNSNLNFTSLLKLAKSHFVRYN